MSKLNVAKPAEVAKFEHACGRVLAETAVRDLLDVMLSSPVVRDRLTTAASAVLLACATDDLLPSPDSNVVTLHRRGGR
jgi:hypothetical protein